ncbi:BBE domain-containing protein [Haloferax sp. AB510]|uniref:BBE domain-containing protein n=1 Tax=Haloferax sp. AB510 TaxID=2934172 RepID=UPI00209BC2BC|nr:BBE domain-containing protein [Haloferax sp. AB510]MCO8268424.1 BBE domain-containing protein [Haloferax sp. AB510]
MDPKTAQETTAWARQARKDLVKADASQDSLYVGWANADKTGEELARAAYGENYDRLVEIKYKYDPAGLFRLDQRLDLTDG